MEKQLLINTEHQINVGRAFGNSWDKCGFVCGGLTLGGMIATLTNLDCESMQTIKPFVVALSVLSLCVPICMWIGYQDKLGDKKEIEEAGGKYKYLTGDRLCATITPLISCAFALTTIILVSQRWNCHQDSDWSSSSSSF